MKPSFLFLVFGVCLLAVSCLPGGSFGQATRDSYDFIVVGAGSAGSIVSAELARTCKSCSILLIEAGGDARDPAIHNTYQHWNLFSPPYSFLRDDHFTVPSSVINNRSLLVNRGKMLGGSFGINAMFHVPGHPADWDQTAAQINDHSWTWAQTQKYRRQVPRDFDIVTYDTAYPGTQQVINAFTSLGYAYDTDDTNGVNGISPARQIGRFNPDRPGGIRETSYSQLVEANNYPNLQIITFHRVSKILINETTKVAYGVQVLNLQSGSSSTYRATRDVIVSAGTFRTPQLLMLSGLGNLAHLQSKGITPVLDYDLPVGDNLNDHVGIQSYWENLVAGSVSPFLFTTPNLIWFGPEATGAPSFEMEISAGFISILPNKINLSGTVRLNTTNPNDTPIVDYNLSSTHEDVLLGAVKDYLFPIVDKLREQGVVGYNFTVFAPGNTDASIRAAIKSSLSTNYHPVGTARVGAANDASAVVDSHFRVRGITGLRVVDSSVFRIIPSGNINSPTLCLAYFAADLIASDHQL